MSTRVKSDWKAFQVPYEKIAIYSGSQKRRYRLSDRTVAMLLSQTAYLYWSSRWSSGSELTDAQKQLIRSWAAQAESELFPECTDQECADYPANDLIITYEPNNPFLTPELIPDGYIVPPWYTNPAIPLPGVLPGDAMVNLLGLPAIANLPNIDVEGLLAAGLPRFRVNVQGAATVELHLVAVPQGGNVIVTVDGGIIPVSVVDLNADLTQLPAPEYPGATVEEITFETDEAHYIDVTFIPIIDNEAGIPIFFGGGLRQVVICGVNDCPEIGDCDLEDVRQRTGAPCKLDKLIDGEWVEFADLRLCKPLVRTGVNGGIEIYDPVTETWTPSDNPPIPSRDPGAGEASNRCLAAANAVNVLVSLHYEVSRSISAPTGIALAGIIAGFLIALLYVPFAIGVILAILTGGAAVVFQALPFGAFTQAIKDELQCILYCNSEDDGDGNVTFDFDAVRAEIAPNIVNLNMWEAIDFYLQIIGEDGLNRAGATTEIAEAECDECNCGWCYEWDFTATSGAWEGYAFPEPAIYMPGVGWRGGYVFVPGQYGGVYTNLRLAIPAGTTITRFEFLYDVVGGYNGQYSGTYVGAFVNGALVNLGDGQADPLGTNLTASWDGERSDFEHIGFFSGIDSAVTTVTIRRAKVFGLGTNPFGADNCT